MLDNKKDWPKNHNYTNQKNEMYKLDFIRMRKQRINFMLTNANKATVRRTFYFIFIPLVV